MSIPRSIVTFYLLTAYKNSFRQVLYGVINAKSKAQGEQDNKLCITQ